MNKLTRFFFLLLFCILTINSLNTASQAMTDEDPNKANGVFCFKEGKPFPRREISVNDILKPNNPYTCGFKLNGKITYPPSKTYFQGQDYQAAWWIQTNDEGKEITGEPNLNHLYGSVYRSDMIDEETGEVLTKNIKGKLYWQPYKDNDGTEFEATFLQTSSAEKVKSGLLHLDRPKNDKPTASIAIKFEWFQVGTGRGDAYTNGTDYIQLMSFSNGEPTLNPQDFSPLAFHNNGFDKFVLDYPNYTLTSNYGPYNKGLIPYFNVEIKKMPDALKNKKLNFVRAKNNYLVVVENEYGESPLIWKGLGQTPLVMFATKIPLRYNYEIYDLNTSQRVKKGYKEIHWNPWDTFSKPSCRGLFYKAMDSTDPNEDLFKGIAKTTRR